MRSLAPRAVLPSTIAARDLREKRDEPDEVHSPHVAPFSLVPRVTRGWRYGVQSAVFFPLIDPHPP